MGMHIVHTHAEGVVSADVVAALREASSKGAAVLVVPSFEAQIAAQKQLAGLSDPVLFGISVTTLSAWIKERWDVWGDGRHLVEKPVRTIAIEQVLLDAGQAEPLPGMLRLLSSLAEEALPWLPLMPNSKVDEFRAKQYGLTAAEASAIGLVGAYADMIHGLGYIEPAEASAKIVPAMERAGAQVPTLVVSGISKLGRSQRELLAAAAIRQGADRDCLKGILGSLTTEEALAGITEEKLRKAVMLDIMEHVAFYLDKRGDGKIKVECLVYSREFGELGCTPGAGELLAKLLEDADRK